MKQVFSLILFTGIIGSLSAQDVEWAINEPCDFASYGNAVTSDSFGNSYVAGYFYPSLQIDSLTFTSSTTFGDLFIAKYDPEGNIVWAEQAFADSTGGQYGSIGESIAFDHSGNIYVTGSFLGSMTIGSVHLIDTEAYTGDIFIAKIKASTGEVLWAEAIEGKGEDRNTNVAVDSKNNFYLSANSTGDVTIGNFHLVSTSFYYHYNYIFLARFDSMGNVIWASQSHSTEPVMNGGITIDKKDNVILTGTFVDEMEMGNLQTGTSGNQVFTAKFNSQGSIKWLNSGGIANQILYYPNAIACDNDQALYIIGDYVESVSFGNITVNGGGGSFLAKYDSSGNIKWVKTFGAGQMVVENDHNNFLYLAGRFQDSIQIGNYVLVADSGDIFIAKFDSSGNVLWAEKEGGSHYDFASGMDAGSNGNIFLTGFFKYSTTIGSAVLNCNCTDDFFLAEFSNTTGIPQINSGSAGIFIYPNPFTAQLQIQYTITQPGELTMYDVVRRKVKSYALPSNQKTFQLSLAELAAGIYLVVINSGGQLFSEKVVKE